MHIQKLKLHNFKIFEDISLVADIAYRMAVLNPQLLGNVCKETEGIVLIDEVDLHLHPTWLQRILGDLREIFPKDNGGMYEESGYSGRHIGF